MVDGGVRIALLARAGKARDQLHAALSEAGGTIVAEGDPSQLDPANVAQHRPNYFLVSLEPAIEAGLERFDELLSGEDVEVMFDDAETTAKLDGWDLNRWARLMASKILGGDTLPPVPAGTPAWSDSWADNELEPETIEINAAPVADDDEGDDLSDSVAMDDASRPDNGLSLDLSAFGDMDLDIPSESAAEHNAPAHSSFGELDFDESISISSFNPGEDSSPGELDVDVAELAAQLEAFDKQDNRYSNLDGDLPNTETRRSVDEMIASVGANGIEEIEAVEAVAVAEPVAAAPSFDFSNLELAPMDGGEHIAVAAPVAAAGLGAVVVLAGLGGPDAVRQLLSSLPETLPVPVLLYQHLEVGKHERLVDQLAKISKLPVVLARDGQRPEVGKVNLLPAGFSARNQGDALVFGSGALSQLLASLSPADSMVIVLSGADSELVPAILAVREGGGTVFAQDPEVCFDSSAAEAMQRQGAAVYPALGLARQIASRWPA
jgi:chemosensory pili system protein ChpB (putative protein-glutamate methylesterase)